LESESVSFITIIQLSGMISATLAGSNIGAIRAPATSAAAVNAERKIRERIIFLGNVKNVERISHVIIM
jgi:hypothetical protein